MITIEQQQRLLINIARKLTKPITVYAVGGTAMMFLGFKDATLDIDLVFENNRDRKVFKEAIESLGYQKMESILVYGTKKNQPQMFKLDDERFDLFVDKIISFTFSDNMKTRAEPIHQFGDKLILKIANPHDLILMKCATDRLKDKDDIRRIINSTKIIWDIVIAETQNQIDLGEETAAFDLGLFLEDLKKELKVTIPQEVLDKLFKIVEKQSKKKIKD